MSHQLIHSDELDADIDNLSLMDEIGFEASDDVETAMAMDMELLLSRLQAARFSGC